MKKSTKSYTEARKEVRKLPKQNNCVYIVYWREEYSRYRVIPKEELMTYDDGTPFEEILFLVEP